MTSFEDKYREKLSAYLDGQLSADEMQEVADHLETCSDCSYELHQLQRLNEISLASEPELSDEILDSLESRINRSIAGLPEPGFEETSRGKVLPIWYRYVAAAASIIFVFLLGRMAIKDLDKPFWMSGKKTLLRQAPAKPQESPAIDKEGEIDIIESGPAEISGEKDAMIEDMEEDREPAIPENRLPSGKKIIPAHMRSETKQSEPVDAEAGRPSAAKAESDLGLSAEVSKDSYPESPEKTSELRAYLSDITGRTEREPTAKTIERKSATSSFKGAEETSFSLKESPDQLLSLKDKSATSTTSRIAGEGGGETPSPYVSRFQALLPAVADRQDSIRTLEDIFYRDSDSLALASDSGLFMNSYIKGRAAHDLFRLTENAEWLNRAINIRDLLNHEIDRTIYQGNKAKWLSDLRLLVKDWRPQHNR